MAQISMLKTVWPAFAFLRRAESRGMSGKQIKRAGIAGQSHHASDGGNNNSNQRAVFQCRLQDFAEGVAFLFMGLLPKSFYCQYFYFMTISESSGRDLKGS